MSNRAVAVQKLRWSGMLEMYKGVRDSLCHFGIAFKLIITCRVAVKINYLCVAVWQSSQITCRHKSYVWYVVLAEGVIADADEEAYVSERCRKTFKFQDSSFNVSSMQLKSLE